MQGHKKKTNKAQMIKGNWQRQAGSLVPYQCGGIATDVFGGRGGGIIRKMKSQGHFLSFFKASPTSE